MSFFVQKFGLLLWKNYVLQKRHKVQTVFEILIPLIFTIILVLIRGIIKSEEFPNNSYFPEFDPKNETFATAAPRADYVLYSPNTDQAINDVMKAVEEKFNEIKLDKTRAYEFVPYPNEEALLTDYENNMKYASRPATANQTASPVLAAVVFSEFKENIHYTIRFPSKMHSSSSSDNAFGLTPRWQTELLYDLFQLPRVREQIDNETDADPTPEDLLKKIHSERGGRPGYWREGFLFLQAVLDTEIIRVKAMEAEKPAQTVDEFNVKLKRYPYPNYIDDGFIAALQLQFPLFLMLSFIYPIINIAKSVTHEKERRLKESMKIMGLPNWLHWCAWFTKSFLFLLIATILLTLFYKIPFYGGGLAILTYSNSILLFVFFLSYAFSTITLGFLVSTFFSAANSASTASGVLFFLTYFPYFFLRPRYDQMTRGSKMFVSIFSNTGMAFGCQIITMFEGTGAGIQWSTIAQGASPDDNLSILDMIIMQVVDGILYFLLAVYIEAVFPGDYGVPLPWYFPFTKWYWCGTSRGGSIGDLVGPPIDSHRQRHNHLFEKEPKGHAGIKIVGLTKIFGKKVAVNDLHLNFYENQVTALLGHNGAGKTTTMSMLTGLFPPTSGTAIVNGCDIRSDIKSVRESLGLCPQHDVLFDELTVEEHLRFFCLLKGVDKEFVDAEIDRMLGVMMLENKRHAQSQTLSGGMKRKLSVGIALIGGSKVVLLDEPTSGMDPGARRSTWDLITNEKKGRTIVLSTHFMDEADLLGDRIAIMAEGQAQCCGSSLFLKKKYGGGYHLIIVKREDCQVNEITKLLQLRIPEVEIDQNIGAELSYSLPDEKSYLFPEMFEELERRKDELGIDSYGCSITQMEEVFMKVGKQVEEEMHRQKAELLGNDKASPVQYSMDSLHDGSYEELNKDTDERNEGFQLLVQQLRAMLVKKCLYAIRNKILLVTQTVIPVAFLIIALIMLKTLPDVTAPPEREMDLSQYSLSGKPVTTVDCRDGEADFCEKYKEVASMTSDVADTKEVYFEDYILDQSKRNLPRVNFQYIIGLYAKDKTLTGFFNNQPFHTPPLALNMISNAILRTVTGNSKYTISMANYPLPYTAIDKVENLSETESEGGTIGFNVAFGMSFLAASFVVFVIKERETKSKHLQYVSGVRFPVFWLAHFIFDAANFLIPVIALMIVLVAFQTKDFSNGEMQGYFLIVLLFYGWSVIPLMYLFSFLFTVPSSGYTRMTFFNFLTGMATILAVSILQIESLDLVNVADTLEWIFMIFPNFDVGYSLTLLSQNRQYHSMCPLILGSGAISCTTDPDFVCCKKYKKAFMSWEAPGIGRHMFFSFLVGLFGFILLFIIESKIIEKIRYRNEQKKHADVVQQKDPNALEDADVAAENARIRNTNLTQLFKTENMILQDLTKFYDSFLAVDRLCLGVQHGECFGLLGVNGAGKTTTFKMLTGDIPITAGNAYIANKSVKSEIKKVQKALGYCPQFDAILPELTGRETIRLFSRLRGIREDKIDRLVDVLAASLLFTEHIEKQCGTYSGGNKRKLSTAIALIGNPPLIFLDEPTTGMDPVARRHLWNTIINVRETGASVVLTSHSMEECEALCTRLAIMVNGKFRCLGSTQHLKNKFGDGYTLIAQMETSAEEKTRRMTRTSIELGRRHSSLAGKPQPWEQELQPLRNFVERNFQGCQLKEVHPGYVHYHIKDEEGVSWGEIFKKMEEAKSLFRLEAYSVGQTTLEQVFLSFTKAQVNND